MSSMELDSNASSPRFVTLIFSSRSAAELERSSSGTTTPVKISVEHSKLQAASQQPHRSNWGRFSPSSLTGHCQSRDVNVLYAHAT